MPADYAIVVHQDHLCHSHSFKQKLHQSSHIFNTIKYTYKSNMLLLKIIMHFLWGYFYTASALLKNLTKYELMKKYFTTSTKNAPIWSLQICKDFQRDFFYWIKETGLFPHIRPDKTDRKRSVLSSPDASPLALEGSAYAPPIQANEPTAILSFGVSKLPSKPASLAAHPATLVMYSLCLKEILAPHPIA
jgi:hypothetical protein